MHALDLALSFLYVAIRAKHPSLSELRRWLCVRSVRKEEMSGSVQRTIEQMYESTYLLDKTKGNEGQW